KPTLDVLVVHLREREIANACPQEALEDWPSQVLGGRAESAERCRVEIPFNRVLDSAGTAARGYHGKGMLLPLTAQRGMVGGLEFGGSRIAIHRQFGTGKPLAAESIALATEFVGPVLKVPQLQFYLHGFVFRCRTGSGSGASSKGFT